MTCQLGTHFLGTHWLYGTHFLAEKSWALNIFLLRNLKNKPKSSNTKVLYYEIKHTVSK